MSYQMVRPLGALGAMEPLPNPASLPGFKSPGPPPVFAGLPLNATELARYNAILDWWNHGAYLVKVGENAKAFTANWPKWYGWQQPLKYGVDQAEAELGKLTDWIYIGFAKRMRFLPADASSHADQYSHGTMLAVPARLGPNALLGSFDYLDEYGRHPEGTSDPFAAVLTIMSYVAPYVPYIGPGLVAAIALAQGKSLDDALLAGIRASLPGGPIAGIAFDIGVAVAMGKDPKDAAAQAAINAIVGSSPEAALAYQAAMASMGKGDGTVFNMLKGQPGGQAVADKIQESAKKQTQFKLVNANVFKPVQTTSSPRNATSSKAPESKMGIVAKSAIVGGLGLGAWWLWRAFRK